MTINYKTKSNIKYVMFIAGTTALFTYINNQMDENPMIPDNNYEQYFQFDKDFKILEDTHNYIKLLHEGQITNAGVPIIKLHNIKKLKIKIKTPTPLEYHAIEDNDGFI